MEHYVKKLRRLYIPTHIQIELTKQCNWKCKFCYAECDGSMGMTKEQVEKLLRDLKKEGALEINFTGGEPLLRKDCQEIFEYAKNLGFVLVLNTNASLINEHNIENIKRLFGRLEISLHSSNARIHDEIVQVKGAWNKTMDALQLFQSCPEKILVKCVLTSNELDDIDIMKKMVKDMGFDFNIDFNITPTYSGSLEPLQYKISGQEMRTLITKDSSYIYRLRKEVIQERYKVKKMSDGICRAGRNLAFIDANGNVYPCITFKTDEKLLYQGKDCLQNVNDVTFSEIWKDNQLFKAIRKLEACEFEKCLECKYDCYCKKCMGVNLKESGSLVEPSKNYCDYADSMFSMLLETENIERKP